MLPRMVIRLIVLHPYIPSLKFVGLPDPKIWVIRRLAAWRPWPFTLKLVRNVSHGTDLPASFDVSATFRCRVMGKPCKHASVMWLYNFDLWPLRSPHTSMTWVIVLHPCTTKFIGLPIPEIFGLMTLTFDLSTSKWGHGASVSWASFLSIFSLLSPSILDLGSETGQTDRQTTAINALCPTLWARGIINFIDCPSETRQLLYQTLDLCHVTAKTFITSNTPVCRLLDYIGVNIHRFLTIITSAKETI